MENVKSQGVVYAEIRFAPQLHRDRGMTQEDAIKAALMEKTFSLTGAQERVILENAVNAAFTTDEVKARIRRMLFPE